MEAHLFLYRLMLPHNVLSVGIPQNPDIMHSASSGFYVLGRRPNTDVYYFFGLPTERTHNGMNVKIEAEFKLTV